MLELPSNEERLHVQWWSFDAVSDDGADILSVRFFNSYIFARQAANAGPAVSIVYSAGGEQVFRSVVEFPAEAFATTENGVSIAANAFARESASYGHGYIVTVSLPAGRGKRIEARIEWLALTGRNDLVLRKSGCGDWKIDSSRSDVSGRLSISDAETESSVWHFRGTGSHSHYSSSDETLGFGVRLAGSAHFVDSTVFFCREGDILSDGTHASVSVIHETETAETIASSAEHYWTRTRYGIRYPRRFLLAADDIRLRVKLMAPYESELCFARFPAEITLTLPDEKQRKAIGCVEVLEPRRLQSKIVRWFSGVGVQRG